MLAADWLLTGELIYINVLRRICFRKGCGNHVFNVSANTSTNALSGTVKQGDLVATACATNYDLYAELLRPTAGLRADSSYSNISTETFHPESISRDFHTATTLSETEKQGDLAATSCATYDNLYVDLLRPTAGLRAYSSYPNISTVTCHPESISQDIHTATTLSGTVKQGGLVTTSHAANDGLTVDLLRPTAGFRAGSSYSNISTVTFHPESVSQDFHTAATLSGTVH